VFTKSWAFATPDFQAFLLQGVGRKKQAIVNLKDLCKIALLGHNKGGEMMILQLIWGTELTHAAGCHPSWFWQLQLREVAFVPMLPM